jgi:hypothetical protein
MPRITEEEWEASGCLKKAKLGDFLHICHNCDQRRRNPSLENLCEGAPHPRCSSMKDGERTIEEILNEFASSVKTTKHCTAGDVDSAVSLLNTCMSREWDCMHCQYWEAANGYEEAFITTHGVEWIAGAMQGLISHFIIHKCIISENEKRKIYTVMSKLTDHLFEKGHIDGKEKKTIKKVITLCRSVNGEKIVRALQKLNVDGYWKALEEEPATKRQRTDQSEDDGFSDWDEDDEIDGEEPVEVKEVREDGWVLHHPYSFSQSGYWSDGPENHDDGSEYFVKLPKEVAKLGKKGMTFSGMNLRCRRGIWSPFSRDDFFGTGMVCGNVYPPDYLAQETS